jgi:hypothetical protein
LPQEKKKSDPYESIKYELAAMQPSMARQIIDEFLIYWEKYQIERATPAAEDVSMEEPGREFERAQQQKKVAVKKEVEEEEEEEEYYEEEEGIKEELEEEPPEGTTKAGWRRRKSAVDAGSRTN